MSQPFRRVPQLSSWRRIALHAWPAPRDPTVYSALEIDVSEAVELIERLRAESGLRVTFTHLVTKAIAEALRRHPDANGIIRHRWVYHRETVDVFVQVVSDEGQDLGGVKISRADEKSILDIARELAERSARVRAHRDPELETTKRLFDRIPHRIMGVLMKLTSFATHGLGLDLSRFGVSPDPFGSVMVSNIGTFGIDWALAPMVPFSRCPIVLLVGTVQQKPRVVDGRVVPRPVLVVGVTFDHRLFDGALAGRMAKVFCDVVAHPGPFLSAATPAASPPS